MTRMTFLGTGTSQGVPIIGCKCGVCASTDPRDKRLRASVLIESGGLTLVVDCGPDFRAQMLRAGVDHLDAVLLTHNHKDHTGGIDELRSFNLIEKKAVNIYCEEYVEKAIRHDYDYAFAEPKYPGSPELRLHRIDSRHPFSVPSNIAEPNLVWEGPSGYHSKPSAYTGPVPSIEVIPIQGWHHKVKDLSVLGFRFGDIAYLTDMNLIDESEFEKLKGVKIVSINCVRREPHFSHFSLPEALAFFEKVGAQQSYITHISHMLPAYEDFDRELPEGVHPAYDGLVVEA